MNATQLLNISDFSETVENLQDLLLDVFYLFLLIVLVVLVILFPFYVYVNKVNRRRDEMMPVFPITNHFYEMMKINYVLFLGLVVSYYLFNFFADMNWSLTSLLFLLFEVLIFLMLHVYTQVFHLLTSVLAIQKFFIYFFPSTESCILMATQRPYSIYLIYLIFGGKETVEFICFVFYVFTGNLSVLRFQSIYFILYLSLNTFLIISSLLYIPILINIRKFSHLPMAQINQPQKYIFWQTMIILIFKTVTIPCALILQFYIPHQFYILSVLIVSDIIITPLMIQGSYLCCNRRNIIAMRNVFEISRFLKTIFNVKSNSTAKRQAAWCLRNLEVESEIVAISHAKCLITAASNISLE
ncbi:hypothetical protein CRE_19447 [Caenorhabditis remanei]|uniref:Serpentine Receptor, class Z n=1 Tax=Caenorhabditis remanei TaxID=31234 RepID=E3NA10_CAERE|nr:hypothetical protein CRE_19447 [Caenorhabditis remanei]